jgi:hypothetical protein
MPKLIISSHLVAQMADLFGEYSDAYKAVHNFKPDADDWAWWSAQVDAPAKLRAEIDRLNRMPASW